MMLPRMKPKSPFLIRLESLIKGLFIDYWAKGESLEIDVVDKGSPRDTIFLRVDRIYRISLVRRDRAQKLLFPFVNYVPDTSMFDKLIFSRF